MKLQFFKNIPLMIAYLLTVLVVSFDAPMWVAVFAGCCILYKFLAERFGLALVSRKMTAGFSIVVFGAVYFQFRNVLTQEAATALLLAVSALKVIDYENSRDHRLIFLLGFILLALKPLYSLDLYWLIPLIICFIAYWWSILSPAQPHPARFLAGLFVISLPMTVLLFIAFPRLVIPWAESRSSKQGNVGFSDSLNPGSVSEILNSNLLVFRVHFLNSEELRPRMLYWRGAVLFHPLGLQWLPSTLPLEKKRTASPKNYLHYEIIQEPDFKTNLFSLDMPWSLESGSFQVQRKSYGIFHSLQAHHQQISYEGYSNLHGFDSGLPSEEFLEVPKIGDKLSLWLKKNTPLAKTEGEKLETLKKFFTDGSFSYTLHPGTYGSNGLDDFLFVRRKGFCEHFAGSFAIMARAMGLPSRVVVGFHGGTYNSFGDFWRVSTKDAHAWTEIYSDGHWQRVDPTSWIAPLRIELGADAFFEIPEDERQSLSFANFRHKNQSFYANWSDQITDVFDHLNYKWTNFLLDFDKGAQRSLIDEAKNNLGWLLLGIMLISVVVRIVLRWIQPSKKQNELSVLFHEICEWGAQRNLPRNISQTPLEYLAELRTTFPQEKETFLLIAQAYDHCMYSSSPIDKWSTQKVRSHWNKTKKLRHPEETT